MEELKDIAEFFTKYIKEPISGKIFLFLLGFGEVSLTQLSELLGKSKQTILRYINPMVDNKVIIEVKKENTRAKYYAVNTIFLDKPMHQLYVQGIKELSQEKRRERYKAYINMIWGGYVILEKLIDPCKDYIKIFEETRSNLPNLDEEMFYQLRGDMEVGIDKLILTEESYNLLLQHTDTFLENFRKERDKLENEKKLQDKKREDGEDYIVFLARIPLKKVLKWS
ncbi:MAG: hypothetical protein ACFFAE_19680 [Candidatus Hodarchaeota archaeon]